MTYKWIGAALVLASCGSAGFSMASSHRKQERLMQQLLRCIQLMQWELQYRLTELPDLCRMAGKSVGGPLRDIFRNLARELDSHSAPDVSGCMTLVLRKNNTLPQMCRCILRQLGESLGRFDLPGQLQGLEAVQDACRQEIRQLQSGRDNRIRSYQTLGLCAGAALAVLFL